MWYVWLLEGISYSVQQWRGGRGARHRGRAPIMLCDSRAEPSRQGVPRTRLNPHPADRLSLLSFRSPAHYHEAAPAMSTFYWNQLNSLNAVHDKHWELQFISFSLSHPIVIHPLTRPDSLLHFSALYMFYLLNYLLKCRRGCRKWRLIFGHAPPPACCEVNQVRHFLFVDICQINLHDLCQTKNSVKFVSLFIIYLDIFRSGFALVTLWRRRFVAIISKDLIYKVFDNFLKSLIGDRF